MSQGHRGISSKRQSPLETKGLCVLLLSSSASKNTPDLTAYFTVRVLSRVCICIGLPSIHEGHQIGQRPALQGADQIISGEGSPHYTSVYTDTACDGTKQECHDRSIHAPGTYMDVSLGEILQIKDG